MSTQLELLFARSVFFGFFFLPWIPDQRSSNTTVCGHKRAQISSAAAAFESRSPESIEYMNQGVVNEG